MVGNILAEYFAPETNRRMLLLSEVFSAATSGFNKNIVLLGKVIAFEFPSFAARYPNLQKNLDSIREFRNVLAHGLLDTTPDWMAKKYTDRIRIINFKRGKSVTREITIEEREKMLKKCSEVLFCLVELSQLVNSGHSHNAE
jgi:hypothetical protein